MCRRLVATSGTSSCRCLRHSLMCLFPFRWLFLWLFIQHAPHLPGPAPDAPLNGVNAIQRAAGRLKELIAPYLCGGGCGVLRPFIRHDHALSPSSQVPGVVVLSKHTVDVFLAEHGVLRVAELRAVFLIKPPVAHTALFMRYEVGANLRAFPRRHFVAFPR